MQIFEITGLERILFVANISGLLYNLQKYDFKNTSQLCRVTSNNWLERNPNFPKCTNGICQMQ